MRRTPAAPGHVPHARMPVADGALDVFIEHADAAHDGHLTAADAAMLCFAMPALLRELRQHRRTTALPALPAMVAANVARAPLRVS